MNPKRLYYLAIGVCLTLACNLVTVVMSQPTPTPLPPSNIIPTYPPIPILPTSIPILVTPTLMPAFITANTEVPCRTGPGETYDLVTKLNTGESLLVVGKATGYWVIKPAATGECWVQAQLVTVAGDTSSLTDIVPPPVPTLGPPAAPANLARARGTCTPVYTKVAPIYILKYEIEYLLTWVDMSNNEDGFYVYRDNDRVGEMAANTTQLTDTFTVRSGGKAFNYYVVAYNAAGETQGEALLIATPCH
jgi:uncharacterized protein YgiM (DUF1202 family)